MTFPIQPNPAIDALTPRLPPIEKAGEGPAPAVEFSTQIRDEVRRTQRVEPSIDFEPVMPGQVEASEPMRGAFSRLAESLDQLRRIQQQQDKLYERIDRGELDPASPEVRMVERRITSEMMNLQITVQQANFGVELISKVVEHGTSGMRTVLQTQA